MLGSYADAAVAHLHQQLPVLPPPHRHQHAALRRVFEGVAQQIAQHRAQQALVGAHLQRTARQPQAQPQAAGSRLRPKFLQQPRQQRIQRHVGPLRLDGAGIEPGDVQQRIQQLGQGMDRDFHLAQDFLLARRPAGLQQTAHQQMDGL